MKLGSTSLLWLHGIGESTCRDVSVCPAETNISSNSGVWKISTCVCISMGIRTLSLKPFTDFGRSQIIDLMEPAYNEFSLAYFYCNYGEAGRRDPASIFRSIVKQLCLQSPTGSLPESVLAIYNKRQQDSDSRPLDINEIKDLLVNLSAGFLQTTIVIDALDECDRGTRDILFDVLEYVMSLAKNPIKIFATSRDDGDLMTRLEMSPNVYIQQGQNDGDINLFINSEVKACITNRKLLNGVVADDLREKIVSTLQEKAHGMYLCPPRLGRQNRSPF